MRYWLSVSEILCRTEVNRLAISVEKEVDDAKGMLLTKLNLDLEKLLVLNREETTEYLSSFEGFNTANIERLAEYMAQIGFNIDSNKSKIYLEKALNLYEIINLKSETFSFEREKNIKAVKNALTPNS